MSMNHEKEISFFLKEGEKISCFSLMFFEEKMSFEENESSFFLSMSFN